MTEPPPTAVVDKSGQRVRRMFGEIAPRYDLMNHVLSAGTDWYWRWRTVRNVPPRGSDPILDVCSGTGDLAIAYWKRTGGRTPVVGADFTHEMLTRAIAKSSRKGTAKDQETGDGASRLPGLAFIEADTQHLPFPDNAFQIVSVAFGLRNVANTEQGLREMVRVCRPGGVVAVLEFSQPRGIVLGSVYRFYFRHILPRVGQWLARNQQDAYNYLPQSVSQFSDGQRLADLMTACGLSDSRFVPLTFGIATLYTGTKR